MRPIERSGQRKAILWSVADVTRERERHENVFQELQHAIDFLDHAPAGFFSCDARGAVTYINATLAAWLDYDLAQVGSGGLMLTDIVAGNGAALFSSVAGRASEVRTEQFDVDLKRRNGQSLPVRIIHRVAFAQDRTPGASRTLVLNRAPGEEPWPKTCALPKCASRASSTRRRWRSRSSTRAESSCAPTPPSRG